MKKILIGLLALGSFSVFANSTKCESKLSFSETVKGRSITSRTLVNAWDLSLSECGELAGRAHKRNLEIGKEGKHTVVYTDSDGRDVEITFK